MTSNDVADRLRAEGWHEYVDDGFIGVAGPFFMKETEAGPIFRFPTAEKHNNRNGVVQGGALMTFSDRALGATARARSRVSRTATIQVDFQFVDAVRVGEVIEASPVVVRDTRHLVFMRTELTVGERTVAIASGVWKKLAGHPLSAVTSEG